jgi:ATP-dependent helicase HrpA
LVQPGFVTDTGWRQLHQLPRYLAAIAYRLDRLPGTLARDRQSMAQVHDLEREYRESLTEFPDAGPALREIRWMIEELRVSLFAQPLGTAYPVSDRRIHKAMDQLTG